MKFIIATQELNYLLNKIRNVVPAKPAVSILGNVLLEAYNDEIIVTATDLNVGMRCVLEAKVLQEGGTTLPAKLVTQLIGELTAPHLEVQTNAHDVTEIIAGGSRFKIHGMGKNEYPSLPDINVSTRFTLTQSDLKDMFFRTSFAVSHEDSRLVLTGVSLAVESGLITLVGTDGKRLARFQKEIELGPELQGRCIIPVKAVDEVLKGLHEEGNATISLMSDKIAIEAGDTTIIAKLLNGDYPDVNRVIPAAPTTVVVLHREELMALLRQMVLFITDTTPSVRFTFEEGELTLAAMKAAIGEGRVKMPINYQGEKLEIAFNPIYFHDILRHCKKERVLLGLDDAFNPGVILDQEDPPLLTTASIPLFVLMPMRLSEE